MPLRSFIRQILPRALHSHALLRDQILSRAKGTIMTGPFTGMEYIDTSFGSVYFPKLLGTYEREIASELECLLKKQFTNIVVVGAAEGYYAIGCALRTEAEIYAFEAHPQARAALLELAQKNGVTERIRIEGICDVRSLNAYTLDCQLTLVLMDIEGGESILLDPEVVPGLQSAHILVEVHEFAVPGVTDLLKQRFTPSHNTNEIISQPRVFSDFPIAKERIWKRLFEGAAIQMMQENRPCQMSWLVMSPKD